MEPIVLILSLSVFDLLAGGVFYYIGNNQYDARYLEDLKRYEAGEIWWWEVRKSDMEMKQKIESCEKLIGSSNSLFKRSLCYLESAKTYVNYYVISAVKETLCFLQYNRNSVALSTMFIISALSLFYIIDWRMYCLKKMKKQEKVEIRHAESEVLSKQEYVSHSEGGRYGDALEVMGDVGVNDETCVESEETLKCDYINDYSRDLAPKELHKITKLTRV